MDTEKIYKALNKAHRYIRTVEACEKEYYSKNEIFKTLRLFTSGDEIKSIEDALAELGVIV